MTSGTRSATGFCNSCNALGESRPLRLGAMTGNMSHADVYGTRTSGRQGHCGSNTLGIQSFARRCAPRTPTTATSALWSHMKDLNLRPSALLRVLCQTELMRHLPQEASLP